MSTTYTYRYADYEGIQKAFFDHEKFYINIVVSYKYIYIIVSIQYCKEFITMFN